MHAGNWEAMYRLEREENIALRQQLQQPPPVETTIVEGWIAQLELIAARLRLHLPSPLHVVELVETIPQDGLTPEEQRTVTKFRAELRKGLGA
jgi:hypothetical protein